MAMLLQTNGRPQALQTLIGAERDCGTGFLQLANAFSAPYPGSSQRKSDFYCHALMAMPQ